MSADEMNRVQRQNPYLVQFFLGTWYMPMRAVISVPGASGQRGHSYTYRWVDSWFGTPYYQFESSHEEESPGETASAINDANLKTLDQETTFADYYCGGCMLGMLGGLGVMAFAPSLVYEAPALGELPAGIVAPAINLGSFGSEGAAIANATAIADATATSSVVATALNQANLIGVVAARAGQIQRWFRTAQQLIISLTLLSQQHPELEDNINVLLQDLAMRIGILANELEQLNRVMLPFLS
jgi:hypothetical protein